MVQKHIYNKNIKGILTLNKSCLADIADLIRTSPTSSRVLLLFMAYADDSNSVITDVKTVCAMLGEKQAKIEYALRNLIRNGYIEATEIKLCHENDIIGVTHDKKLFVKSNNQIWKVVGEKLVTTVELNGTYNRFRINENIAMFDNGQKNNMIKHIKGNLFYDNRIRNNEIIWEL